MDIDVGYGYRSTFRSELGYLHVDITPNFGPADETALISSASSVASQVGGGEVTVYQSVQGPRVSFEFVDEGVPSIDIFFVKGGDGFAVVAGSGDDPAAVFSVARSAVESIRPVE